MNIFLYLISIIGRIFSREKLSRVYGWSKDVYDIRDLWYRYNYEGELPSMIDLSNRSGGVYDQGNLGSCSANAVGGLVSYEQRKMNGIEFSPSRLFMYFNGRKMRGSINEDSGASIRDVIKSINVEGVCREEYFPYIESKFRDEPSTLAYMEAKYHRSLVYMRLDNSNIRELKSCLFEGHPFVFGFAVYEKFESEVGRSGRLSMPIGERYISGHAVMCVGYNDITRMFLVKNSWGAKWGKGGYFWMPYEYMTSSELSSDFWVIKLITS